MTKTKNFVLLIAALVSFGCNHDETQKQDEQSTLDGYGEDEIGFRNAIGDDKSNNGETSADSADYEYDPGGATGDTGGSATTDDSQDTTDTDTQANPADLIDSDYLSTGPESEHWYGMVYEGLISELNALSSTTVDVQTAGLLEEFSLRTNPGNLSLADQGDSLLSEAYITNESAELKEDFVVTSIFDKTPLAAFANNTEFNADIPTLVIKNTYQKADEGQEVLRSSCIVATHKPSQDQEPSATGICHNQQGDGDFTQGDALSLGYKTPLTIDETVVSQEYAEVFQADWPEFQSSEDLCLCYTEDGEPTEDCSFLSPEAKQLPPPPEQTSEQVDDNLVENPYYTTANMPTTTFSIDVDTASYTLVRQALNNGSLPNTDSVRIEEMINYFKYNYTKPTGDNPFTIYTEMGSSPFNHDRKIVMLGLRGQEIEMTDQPAANLVYLLDTSGSMMEEIAVIKGAFRMLTNQLRPQDTISIVTYAGSDKVVIDGGRGDNKAAIHEAINSLQSYGSTNGAGGIQRAYEIAAKHFVEGGNNRVILATDGDFNVGISDDDALVEFIKEKAQSDVFLTVYGFNSWGAGNYQDTKMEQMANHGNGTYFFIDSGTEARRAFMHSLSGTLLTIAKDVKLQIQFNPELVKGYRLIGYDNRALSNDDFNNDSVDAGELGNSEDMTAIFEIIPADSDASVPPTDVANDLNADSTDVFDSLDSGDFMAVRLRYKNPDKDESELITHPVSAEHLLSSPTKKLVFASSVAHLGMILRQSRYIERTDVSEIKDRLERAFASNECEPLTELLALIDIANSLL